MRFCPIGGIKQHLPGAKVLEQAVRHLLCRLAGIWILVHLDRDDKAKEACDIDLAAAEPGGVVQLQMVHSPAGLEQVAGEEINGFAFPVIVFLRVKVRICFVGLKKLQWVEHLVSASGRSLPFEPGQEKVLVRIGDAGLAQGQRMFN